ncbi:MAG: antitoxin component YwqK of YwqJK toxin-antitoxin module [Crocinitomicaceae bacterium]|jgi:antitoxin component YwqK of YwqJK toxin-antitoxin module
MKYDDTSYYTRLDSPIRTKYNWLNVYSKFNKDNPSGIYVLKYRDDSYSIGNVIKGKRLGIWKTFNSSGRLIKRETFKHGWLVLGVIYNKDSDTLTAKTIVHFKKGIHHGKAIHFNDDGKAIVKYHKGQSISVERIKYYQDTIITSLNESTYFKETSKSKESVHHWNSSYFKFRRSNPDGFYQVQINKIWTIEGLVKNGKREGLWVRFNADLNFTDQTSEYVGGKLNGKLKVYEQNFRKTLEISYVNDLRHGTILTYYPNGEINCTIEYENDEEISRVCDEVPFQIRK